MSARAPQKSGAPPLQIHWLIQRPRACLRNRTYLPDARGICKEGLLAKKLGFRGYKLHPPEKADLDIECCKRVREAVGSDFPLMSYPVGAYNFEEVMRVGRGLEVGIPLVRRTAL